MHVHVHVNIYTCILYSNIYILYPLQEGCTPLFYAVEGGDTTCVERLLSTPGIDVDTAFQKVFNC